VKTQQGQELNQIHTESVTADLYQMWLKYVVFPPKMCQ